MKHVCFWTRLFDLISPRHCMMCGERLSPTEEVLCACCNLHLPRTGFQHDAYENTMARMMWGQFPVERAAALFYYESHSEAGRLIYHLKYYDHPEVGEVMGHMMGREMAEAEFFEGIDLIVPVPLSKKRERQRGYNQSVMLAQGLSEATGLPVCQQAVRRTVFLESQTRKVRWERRENVEHVFRLENPELVSGKHLLLVDDVVTTGATMTACAHELLKAGNVKISVLSLGFTKSV